MFYFDADGIPLSYDEARDIMLAHDVTPPRPVRREFADSEGVPISRARFLALVSLAAG
jgi:hypothetical protein